MTLLLIVIYFAFISLGLPDAVLGALWPQVRMDFGVPLSYAGIVSLIVCAGTIVSSLLSVRLVRRLQTKGVTLISVLLTATALLGYAQAQNFWWLCLMAIPLGLGAGSIDSALNNFVALHYKARQMNWLHCFWGVGATAGPVILSAFMVGASGGWRSGVIVIAAIQFFLALLLLISIPLWKKAEILVEVEEKSALLTNTQALRLPGARTAVFGFFCYCAAETTTGLWASSYLVGVHALSTASAAGLAALYYAGIAVGRFVCGVLTSRFSSKALIRVGTIVAGVGAVLLALPLPTAFCCAGLPLIGLGCAPIFPSMLHETPVRFGKQASQAVIGLQMACAYVGSMAMPPLFGWLAQYVSAKLYPFYLLFFFVLLLFICERTNFLAKSGVLCHNNQ